MLASATTSSTQTSSSPKARKAHHSLSRSRFLPLVNTALLSRLLSRDTRRPPVPRYAGMPYPASYTDDVYREKIAAGQLPKVEGCPEGRHW